MRQVDPNSFKISPHACSQIMAGNVGLTEKQFDTMNAYALRLDEGKKPLTPKMQAEYERLVNIVQNPVLPQGAKTYCEKWLTKKRTGRSKWVTSKEMEKGLEMEEWAIQFVADFFDTIMVKNEDTLSNDWIVGTHDQNTGTKVVRDIKCPWDVYTFPYYDTECPNIAYYWQLQCYMSLTNCERAELVYVLADTPLHLIEQAARSKMRSMGETELSTEMFESFYNQMTYGDMDDCDRIKVFHIERDETAINCIKARVGLCREYIQELCER